MAFSEAKLIAWIQNQAQQSTNKSLIFGIGDDCAAIKLQKNSVQLITTDSFICGVHFDRKYFSAFAAGYKALVVNVSDIAAMGAKPEQALLSLAIDPQTSLRWIQSFIKGYLQCAKEYQVALVGGNVARSKQFQAHTTLLGSQVQQKIKKRNFIQPGDQIWVTGPLGYAEFGRKTLSRNPKSRSICAKKHLKPKARVAFGQFLAKQKTVVSMLDISDGLLRDLSRLIDRQNPVQVQLDLSSLPLLGFIRKNKKEYPIFREAILGGGEDYELLFVVRGVAKAHFEKKLQAFGFKAYYLGEAFLALKTKIKVVDHFQKEFFYSRDQAQKTGFHH